MDLLGLISNEVAYWVYFIMLIGTAIAAEIKYRLPAIRPKGTASMVANVRRGPQSLGVISGTFAIITGINLGIAQTVLPLMSAQSQRFAFVMLLAETFAWAYFIFINGWVRNRIIDLANQAADER